MTDVSIAAPTGPMMPQEQIDASMRADVDGGLYDLATANQLRARDGMPALSPWSSSGNGGGKPPAAGNPAAATPSESSHSEVPGGEFTGWSSTAQSDAAKALQWLKDSNAPQSEIDAYAKEHGLYRSPELQKIYEADAAVGAPISESELEQRAGQFEWPSMPGVDESSDAGLDTKLEIGRTLAKVGFDRQEGSTFIGLVAEADARTAAMDDLTYDLHVKSETAKLQRLWGADFGPRIQQINAFLAKIPNAKEWLDQSGGSADAMVISQIWSRIQHGRHALAEHRNKSSNRS